MRKKDISLKSFLFISAIFIIVFLVCLLVNNVYSGWEENNAINMQKENKKKITNDFEENKGVFDTLVEKIYSKNEEIRINYSDGNIQFLVDGKEEKLDEEYYNLFNKLYNIQKYERISLHKRSSGNKVLEIYLGDGGSYYQSIIFCKDKSEGFTNELSPGWYYRALWHT